MAENVIIPQMGESITEGILAQWMVSDGQYVNEGDALFELETDKVSTEVPAPCSGTITLQAEEGATLDIGAVVAAIDSSAVSPASDDSEDKKEVAAETAAPTSATAPAATATNAGPVGPTARKLIAENDLNAQSINSSGKKGVTTQNDVVQHLQKSPAPTTATTSPSASPQSSETRTRMSTLRQRIATRLVQAQHTAAILSTFNEIDMHNAMALRSRFKEEFAEKHGVKLGFMSFFAKACIEALKKYPLINSYIDGTDVVTPNGIHMSIAVGTPKGLVVPVLRHTENMSFAEIEKTIRAIAAKARDGKLSIDDMTGGSFTITNGGVYGSLLSTPILNPPQSGILGMHAIKERPIALNGEVVIRPMMYIALSYDHRIVDGSEAVGFLVRIKELIENPERLIFDL